MSLKSYVGLSILSIPFVLADIRVQWKLIVGGTGNTCYPTQYHDGFKREQMCKTVLCTERSLQYPMGKIKNYNTVNYPIANIEGVGFRRAVSSFDDVGVFLYETPAGQSANCDSLPKAFVKLQELSNEERQNTEPFWERAMFEKDQPGEQGQYPVYSSFKSVRKTDKLYVDIIDPTRNDFISFSFDDTNTQIPVFLAESTGKELPFEIPRLPRPAPLIIANPVEQEATVVKQEEETIVQNQATDDLTRADYVAQLFTQLCDLQTAPNTLENAWNLQTLRNIGFGYLLSMHHSQPPVYSNVDGVPPFYPGMVDMTKQIKIETLPDGVCGVIKSQMETNRILAREEASPMKLEEEVREQGGLGTFDENPKIDIVPMKEENEDGEDNKSSE